MWGDAGNHFLGHGLARLDPWRWSPWGDRDSTVENLKSYNTAKNRDRPVEVLIGKPPHGNHMTFANIDDAVDFIDPPKKPSHDIQSSNGRLVPLLFLGAFVFCAFIGCIVFCWVWNYVPKTSRDVLKTS